MPVSCRSVHLRYCIRPFGYNVHQLPVGDDNEVFQLSQTQTEAAVGSALPPEMTRFVFQSVEEASADIAPMMEGVSTPSMDAPFPSAEPPPRKASEDQPPPAMAAPEDAPQFPLFQFGQNSPEQMSDQPVKQTVEAAPAPARRTGSSERLPPTGVARFQQLLADFQTSPAGGDPAICLHDNPYALSAIQILAAKSDAVLTWEDLDRMEIALLRVLPEARLRSQAWSLRARYFESAGPTLSALYFASRPPGWNDATVSTDLLRADLESLVSETQRNRILPPEIDFMREFVSEAAGKWAIGLCLSSIVGFIAARFVLAPSDATPILPLSAALISGAVGGFLSLQSRLSRAVRLYLPQQDKVQSVLEIPNLYLFPVQGALLAALFYFLLLGGFLKGKIFPSVALTVLATPEGGARLIVWCFLIGLLVRFLPDIPKWLHKWLHSRRSPQQSESTV